MISKIKTLAVAAITLPVFTFGVMFALPTVASAACDPNNVSVSGGADCAKSDEQKTNMGTVIQDITNILLFIIGAVAVIMIILGGIRYTTSNGDSSQITAAKNTILYGVIGVIVALLAYAIVNFVVGAFSQPSGGPSPSKDAAS